MQMEMGVVGIGQSEKVHIDLQIQNLYFDDVCLS